MHWNHRVFEKTDYFGEKYFEIHEVYYNDDGTINGFTVNPIAPMGISVDDLKWALAHMIKCLDNPILRENDIECINYEDGDFYEDFED